MMQISVERLFGLLINKEGPGHLTGAFSFLNSRSIAMSYSSTQTAPRLVSPEKKEPYSWHPAMVNV